MVLHGVSRSPCCSYRWGRALLVGRRQRTGVAVVTAVLIVACPCALALSMPFAYGHTIRLLGKRGLFLRDAEVVERMAHVDTVVFDKTGTLTAREAHDVH